MNRVFEFAVDCNSFVKFETIYFKNVLHFLFLWGAKIWLLTHQTLKYKTLKVLGYWQREVACPLVTAYAAFCVAGETSAIKSLLSVVLGYGTRVKAELDATEYNQSIFSYSNTRPSKDTCSVGRLIESEERDVRCFVYYRTIQRNITL